MVSTKDFLEKKFKRGISYFWDHKELQSSSSNNF